jgi:hypothetical protein
MASTFRIPKARITGLDGRMLTAYARRTWGQVPGENERGRFNSASGIQAQGFSDVCEIPMPNLASLHVVRSNA